MDYYANIFILELKSNCSKEHYDIQFFTLEYPEYIGTQYNDKITITVDSPSQGTTEHIIDVNGGDFVLNANDLNGSGYDVFATSGNPADVDWLTTTPNPTGADGGATALVGREHSVSPNEQITITFNIEDIGDNQFDSTVFIIDMLGDNKLYLVLSLSLETRLSKTHGGSSSILISTLFFLFCIIFL